MHSDRDRQVYVDTQYPLAFDSPDHIFPWGTKNDNSTNSGYIEEVESNFVGRSVSVLDIGCSGGLLVRNFFDRGHQAVGIEGSDYSVQNGRAEWIDLYNKNLFTCDASRDYQIRFSDTNDPVIFDVISAWEVVEHIHPERLDVFFLNILKHLSDNGFFIASISTNSDTHNGLELHQSLFSELEWKENILSKYFEINAYPFSNYVRFENGSFYVKLTKRI
jgi:2-polyprenyl-3-methyl-5-hydroxy-6-metoxy-1,4-benzoquinol methylase